MRSAEYTSGMEYSRRHVTIALPGFPVTPQPRGRVRRFAVYPRGYAPVDALIGVPEDPQGLTLQFVGFNASLGPWEAAKLALWASLSRTVVVTCELPGFSRYGHPLPRRIREDLLNGDPTPWAMATLASLRAAAQAGGLPTPKTINVLGFSMGCSLAVAALPTIQALYDVSSLTLVEPISLTSRTIGRLAVNNMADLMRLLKTVPRNYPSSWVWKVSLRQLREPSLRFTIADFLASVTMLASDDTGVRMDSMDLPVTNLAHGSRSKLCPAPQFSAVDSRLASRGVPGITATIDNLGHDCWHCLPALDALARSFDNQISIPTGGAVR